MKCAVFLVALLASAVSGFSVKKQSEGSLDKKQGDSITMSVNVDDW